MEKFLTVEEAARVLQVNADTVRRWLRSGELTGRKLGRVWRIAQGDLRAVPASNPEPDKEDAPS